MEEVAVVVGFGTGVGKWVASASEFWSLVSPLCGSPIETFLSHAHTDNGLLATQERLNSM